MKPKILVFLLITLLLFSNFMASIKVQASTPSNFALPLTFTPKQLVVHPTKPIVYGIDYARRKVYAVNYETKIVSSLQLDLAPERLYFANNELFIALLKSGHTLWNDAPQQGAIAIVNPDNFILKDEFAIDIDPFDLVVDKNNYIYVLGGSNQWTHINSYSRQAKKKVSATSANTYVRFKSYLTLNPTLNQIYTITTEDSPRDMSCYAIKNGTFPTAGYTRPYNGNDSMDTLIKVSPDGKYIFNSKGSIFTCSSNQNTDMRYYKSLDSSFSDIDFDLQNNNNIYIGTGNKIKVYSYKTLEPIASAYTNNSVSSLFVKGSTIIAVTKDPKNKYYIEMINKSIASTCNINDSAVPNVTYQAHVQSTGWQGWVKDGSLSGTEGKTLRIEALKIKLLNAPDGAKIRYQAHVQNIGWQDFSSDGEISGTTGQSCRLEAIRILLENAPGYSIQYQTYVQNVGWQDWFCDGMSAGITGKGLSIQAIRIKIVKSGNSVWNIANRGQVVQQNNLLYYSDASNKGALYKSSYDGTQKSRLTSDNVSFINIVDNWIYYSNYSDKGNIYKIKTDGTSKTKLNNVESTFVRVVGDSIYYCSPSNNKAMYKMNLDGTNIQRYTVSLDSYLFSSSEDTYYIDNTQDKSLYRYVTSKNSVNKVADSIISFNVSDDYVFYTGSIYNDMLCITAPDGFGVTYLDNANTQFISVIGNWVYFNNASDNNRLYRVRKDGVGMDLIGS